MNERMRPSQALEQYDIVGRSVSEKLLTEIQSELSEQESGRNAWHVLVRSCEKFSQKYQPEEERNRKVVEDIQYVHQAIAEILIEERRDPWFERVESLRTIQQFRNLFLLLNIPENKWRNSFWLQSNGYNALCAAIVDDRRFSSWKIFIACMDEKLPLNGFTSKEEVHEYLDKEILRLRTSEKEIQNSEKPDSITREEYIEIAEGKYYDTNIVVRAITDYLDPRTIVNGKKTMPSNVLSEYTIVGRKIPDKVIEKTRCEFAQMEDDGFLAWKILCDAASTNGDKQSKLVKRIEQDRLWITQACAEVIMEGGQYGKDGRSWCERLEALETTEDFLRLFLVLNIQESKWQSSKWLSKNGYTGLLGGLIEKFGSWNAFIDFMGVIKPTTLPMRMRQCKSTNDFKKLSDDLGIPAEKRLNAGWLNKNGYGSFVIHIYHDQRFKSWKAYQKFHGEETRYDWVTKFSQCETEHDLIKVLLDYGIPRNYIMGDASDLRNNGFGNVYDALFNFYGSWDVYREFIGLKKIVFITDEIRSLQTTEAFVSYFQKSGIPDEKWRSSTWLNHHFSGIYSAILHDGRFISWPHFKLCMDNNLPLNGFTSRREARKYLHNEILRLRLKGKWIKSPNKSGRITQEEYCEIAKEKYYDSNIVIQVISDFLKQSAQTS